MHVECSSCHARYVIADEKIPVQGARVRCRKCQSVFSVERPAPTDLPLIPPTPQAPTPLEPPSPFTTSGSSPFQAPPAAEPSPFTSTPSPFSGPPSAAPSPFTSSSAESNPFDPPPAPAGPSQVAPTEVERFSFGTPAAVFHQPAPAAPAPSEPKASAPETVSPFSPSAGIPPGLPEAERVKHERARRLARVLASDIAIYNKEKRDRGVQEGNLVAVLGYEIKKSWEVYKERVTPELANATPYFRDALNEMLAEGKKVF
jgi:predicted Zn finger-like uncharacterized protein